MNMLMWPVGRGTPAIGLEVGALCMVFSREETQGLRVGRSVDDLMLLADDNRLRRQVAQRVFFSFDGWDADAREAMCIPDCRDYLRQVHAHWPYWLHFLALRPELWSVLLLCLAKPLQQASDRPGSTKITVDTGEVCKIVGGMLLPLNLLHQDMSLVEAQRQKTFERSMGAIRAVLA